MIVLDLYSKDDCSLCERVKATIRRVQQDIPFTFREVLLVPGTDLEKELRNDIPVLHINGVFFSRHFLSGSDLTKHLMNLVDSGKNG